MGEKYVWFAAATGASTVAELHFAWNVGVQMGRTFDALDNMLRSVKKDITRADEFRRNEMKEEAK